MSKLKVYGGLTFTARVPRANGNRQARTIVAARNRARAVELLSMNQFMRITRHGFDGYWCESGNRLELSTATEEGVWVNQGTDHEPQFERVL